MPVFRSHIVIEIARGIKAFLDLDAGLVRGEVPDQEKQLKAQQRKLRQAQDRMERDPHGVTLRQQRADEVSADEPVAAEHQAIQATRSLLFVLIFILPCTLERTRTYFR